MWNFAALDTSSTINRRTYSQTGVIHKASSNARKTQHPAIPTPSNFFSPANTWDFRPTRRPPHGLQSKRMWLRRPWAAAGPGRASRSTTPSAARVWRSRGRAAAHGRTEQPPPRPTGTPDWRPPSGLRGLAGLRADAPSEARSADGERAGRPRGGRRSGGPQQAGPRAAAAQ